MNVMNLKRNLNKIKENKLFLNLLLYFGLIFCFEPKIFVKYNFFNAIYVIGILLSFGVIVFMYILDKKRFSSMFLIVVAFRASFFIQTLINDRGDILMWGYMSIVLMTLCLLIDYYAKKDINKLIDAIVSVLGIMLLINLLLGFIFPKGIKNELHFIGIRTRFTDLIFPLLACTAFLLIKVLKQGDTKTKKIAIIKSSSIVFISLITILKFKIATAIVGIFIFAVAFFVFLKMKKVRKIWIVIVLALFLNALLVLFRITDWFEWLIVGVLNKSKTLSGRTEIWDIAIDVVRKSIIFGYGMADNGGFVWWGYTGAQKGFWQAHNQWLQLLYDGGLVTLLIFVFLIYFSGMKIKHANGCIASIYCATVMAFMIMMVAEIYSYTPYLFIILFLGQHIEKICKEKEIKTLEEKDKKVALIAAYNDNYGSLLQVYATQTFLIKNGYDCEIINYKERDLVNQLLRCFNLPLLKMKYDVLYRKFVTKIFYKEVGFGLAQRQVAFENFRTKHLKFSERYQLEEDLQADLKSKYKFVMLGSDQVWNPINMGTHFFTMEIVPEECFKMTYAPSFGVKDIPWYQKRGTRHYLNRIQKISVREERGQKIIENLTGRQVPIVCDPTLLVEKEVWEELAEKKSLMNEKYLFCYFLGDNLYQREIAKEIAKERNLKIVSLKHLDSFVKSDIKFGDYELFNVGPSEFIKLIKDAECILTDSFHGTIFSILNHKEFLTLPRFVEKNHAGTNSRIENLLNKLSINNKFFNKYCGNINDCLNQYIDWDKVDKKIEEYRQFSKNYCIESFKEALL